MTTARPAAPVLVTGATGRIGRRVVDRLVEAGVPVRALTRRPADADLPSVVEVVSGDLTAPDSIETALDGVTTVFLVWTLPLEPFPAVLERFAAKTQRVVFLSSPHQTPHPFFQQPNPGAALHAEIERQIGQSGLASTMIRPGMFASNVIHWWSGPIANGDVVRWPYLAAETAPVDERDVAAVAAQALIDDSHAGGDYVVTGPESLSQADQLRVIGDAIGHGIDVQELSPDEFRREAEGTWPRPVLDMLMAAWAATLGQPAFVTSTVLDVLGSPPRTFSQWAVEHAHAFQV